MAGNLGSLDLHEMPPIGPAAVLQPVSRKPLDPEGGGAQERWLFDFGVNIAGFARLNVTALVPPGSESVIQMKVIRATAATSTALFLRPYLAHFCSFSRRFFAVFSVLTRGIRKVAPEDRGSVP